MQPHFFVLPLSLVLILSGLPARAQEKTDSLLILLKENPHDTVKVDIYLSLNLYTINQDSTQSMEYLQEAFSISKKIDDKYRLARCYLRLAHIYDLKGNLYGAKAALDSVKKEIKNLQNDKIEATFYMQRGIIFYFEGTYNEAVKDLWQALILYEKLGDSVTVASCYMTIGTSHMELEKIDQALEYYQKALSIYKNNGYEDGMAMALGNIGIIYKARKEYEKALTYYKQSLNISQKNNRHEDAMIDLNNIGSLYMEMGDYNMALKYLQQSMKVAESIGSQSGTLNSYYNIGILESKLGNYQTAIRELNKVLELAKTLNYKEDIKDIYKGLSDIYEEMGEFKLALQKRKEYENWKDSLINENHLNQIKELEVKYETEKKDQQIVLLAEQKKVQETEIKRQATLKKAFVGGFLAVIILAALLVYILRQRLKNQKLLSAKNEEIKNAHFKQQLTELETKALRAQINPHFLFNCLNSINRMILQGETEDASIYLAKFSKLIRLILENAEANTVSLENELAMLESYIQLEALRFKGKITYQIQVDEAIEPESTYLPSMVLQPFVENAIWHGLMHKESDDKGMITIAIREEEDRLLCTIEDNGVGREKAQVLQEKTVLKSKSMGMKITEERLRLLSKERLEQLIRITDLKDAMDFALGTRVEINIPIS